MTHYVIFVSVLTFCIFMYFVLRKLNQKILNQHALKYKLRIKQLDNAIINVRLQNAREWKELQDRCDLFEKRFHLACAQNYCTICGNTLDGYVPPEEEGEKDEDNTNTG